MRECFAAVCLRLILKISHALHCKLLFGHSSPELHQHTALCATGKSRCYVCTTELAAAHLMDLYPPQ